MFPEIKWILKILSTHCTSVQAFVQTFEKKAPTFVFVLILHFISALYYYTHMIINSYTIIILDMVGPFDNRPLPNKLHHFV